MEILYQGTDITDMVQVNACTIRDSAAGRCDSMELEFGNAAGWYSWGPEEDDQIIVAHSGYVSGPMYVNKILPEDGKYRILAASLPCKARAKEYRSFIGYTIEEIIRACAAAAGMDYRLYGIDGGTVIPYIERDNEGCASFLHKLLTLESAALKCVNGRFAAISYSYAQAQDAAQTMRLSAKQEGARYRRDGTMYKCLTVKTPYAAATAEDVLVADGHAGMTVNYLPAMDNVQAGRWARGKLLYLNRQCESVVVQSSFNAGLTALSRVNIVGDTDATGLWLVDELEHDIKNMITTTTMRRCNYTII